MEILFDKDVKLTSRFPPKNPHTTFKTRILITIIVMNAVMINGEKVISLFCYIQGERCHLQARLSSRKMF